ncbi:MAG: alanine dehydrogenase [Chitinophagaceae bacterium]|nr:alanine dehydrogenase [Chitinophagaceae bacterium]
MSEERKIKMPEELKSGIGLAPKESLLEVARKQGHLFIGVPKERHFQENRVSLTPGAVSILSGHDHRIIVESKAGEGSHISDTDYSEAGAEIAYNTKEVFQAGIVLKVAPLSKEEIQMLHPGQIIISAIHLPTVTQEYLELLLQKRVIALAYEYIQDESDSFPIVSSMSEIAGSTSILIAAELLSNLNHGKGILLGGIAGVPPANVVILGAGTVGENAARTAIALGAEVKIFDNSIYKLKRLQRNIGARVFTSIIRQDVLGKALARADVAVGAVHSKSGRAPIIVTEDMVSKMRPGSVIIDVSIDQGGCFETSEVTTHTNPIFKKFDIIHYCVPNIPSRVPRTASQAISNVFTTMLREASDLGGFEKLMSVHPHIRNGVYVYKGTLTNRHLSEKFNMKSTDLNLLFTSGM